MPFKTDMNTSIQHNSYRQEHFLHVAQSGGIKHIFLGEDDLDDQDFFKEAIESVDKDFNVTCFSNGKQLVDKLQELTDTHLPSLIVLDFNLPLLNGAEILQVLNQHARFRQIPKLIWSTSSSPACKSSCLDNGAADYIVKPSDLEGLRITGRKMIDFIG